VEKSETSIDGLPYVLMLRQVLQYSSNLKEAIEMVKKTPRTVGLNIMLAFAHDNRAVVMETSLLKLLLLIKSR
jgi:predicted choloylglycine hydrolase